MLSIVDLLRAGTLTPELAGYLLAAIGSGASFMTGANPGGAGKTTIMCALLNFIPADLNLKTADTVGTIADGIAHPTPRSCWICHEIRNSGIFSYLWNGPLRAYFELGRAGHMLATNLHADTFEEARDQVCGGDNQVPESDFRLMNLAIFIETGGGKHVIGKVWESDGKSAHRQVYSGGRLDTRAVRLVAPTAIDQGRKRIDKMAQSGARTIEEVRKFLAG